MENITKEQKIEVIREKLIEIMPEIEQRTCAESSHFCVHCGDSFSTDRIGIRDVLLAIKKKDLAIEQKIAEATGRDGCKSAIFYHFMQAWMAREGRMGEPDFWNIRNDDLAQQSEETINLIYELIKDDGVFYDVTFGHIDGMYLFCTIDDLPEGVHNIFHLSASTSMKKVGEHYEID